jgi:hypothetical protein
MKKWNLSIFLYVSLSSVVNNPSVVAWQACNLSAITTHTFSLALKNERQRFVD